MKILYLTADLPLPADQGGKLRSLALIRAAAEHHQVDLLSFARHEPSPEARAELDRICHTVRTVPAPRARPLPIRAWQLFFDAMPDIAHRLDSGAYRSALWEMLEAERYDVIQIEGLEMMPYLGTTRSQERAAVVYDAFNAEMYLQRTIWQTEFRDPRHWLGALYSMTQWSKLGTYERVTMNGTHMVLAVSPEDAAKLKGRHVDPVLVPNGIDTVAIPFRQPALEPGRTLLFLGPLDYRPNADAVRWLVSRILPEVRQRIPEARLRLIGRGSERIHAPGVEALGYVEDIAAELERADAIVVPMRMGGGVRFKVLEAMAAGIPLVTTPRGIAGVVAEHGRHVLIARGAADFAEAVVQTLEDRVGARDRAKLARLLVEGRYDWRKITPGYLQALTSARRLARSVR
ncbi:MAG: polysaccharide biosynthesis protein PslH [Chloroflexota bacterium]|nr:polysaccharide biosynthesis protein PslH [Chloroflexota bacterium]